MSWSQKKECNSVREDQQSLEPDDNALRQTSNSSETRHKQLSQPTRLTNRSLVSRERATKYL